MIELEAFRTVEGQQRHGRAFVECVGIGDQRGAVEEIGERLAVRAHVADGVDEFAEIFRARGIFRGISLVEHIQVAGAI